MNPRTSTGSRRDGHSPCRRGAGVVLVAAALGALTCAGASAQPGHDAGTPHHDAAAARAFDRDASVHGGEFAPAPGASTAPSMIPVHGFHGGHRGGGRGRGGAFVFIAPGPFYDPFFYPFGAPYYGYYPPPIVTVPTAPPVYVQRPPPPVSYSSGYWYWCSAPQGYYPAVQTCPGGWQAVAPSPPVR